MQRTLIEVSQAALKKIAKAGIRYTIINDDVNLENFLMHSYNVDELDECELGQIVNTAKEAMKKGDAYGIAIETQSGRNNQDERCYWLTDISIVSATHDDCCHTVAALIKGSKS
jgi:hypothetical protein